MAKSPSCIDAKSYSKWIVSVVTAKGGVIAEKTLDAAITAAYERHWNDTDIHQWRTSRHVVKWKQNVASAKSGLDRRGILVRVGRGKKRRRVFIHSNGLIIKKAVKNGKKLRKIYLTAAGVLVRGTRDFLRQHVAMNTVQREALQEWSHRRFKKRKAKTSPGSPAAEAPEHCAESCDCLTKDDRTATDTAHPYTPSKEPKHGCE